MPINFATLKGELQSDPAALGLTALYNAGNDQACAAVLNFPRDGVTPCPVNAIVGTAITVRRTDISSQELLEALDTRDLPSVTAGNQASLSWFESATQQRTLRLVNDDGTPTRVKGNLDRLFGNTQGSQTRLNQVSSRIGSRAEALFGTGTTISASDIGETREL